MKKSKKKCVDDCVKNEQCSPFEVDYCNTIPCDEPQCDILIPSSCIRYYGDFLEQYGVESGATLTEIITMLAQQLFPNCFTTTTTTTISPTTTTTSTTTTSTSTTTTVSGVEICLSYDIDNNSSNACGDIGNCTSFYISQECSTLPNLVFPCQIFTDITLTTIAPEGVYSDGTNWYQINNMGTVVTWGIC